MSVEHKTGCRLLGLNVRRSVGVRRLVKSLQRVAQAPTDEGKPSDQHFRGCRAQNLGSGP
jgi:hypothetical protein